MSGHTKSRSRSSVVCRPCQLILLFAIGGAILPAAAQQSAEEFRPELGIYAQQGEFIRVEFIDFASSNQHTHEWQGDFAYFIETALKPPLRRRLREHPDVYRNRYLTARAGYRYQTGLTNGNSSSGNIGILEALSRYRLPSDLVISDRSRGEFRFIKGQPFSARYRNRLRLERDLKRGVFVCTPYVFDEIFYDTRYGTWTPNRYAAGAEFPVGRHMVFDAYYMLQNSSRSDPHLNIIGFRWSLYF